MNKKKLLYVYEERIPQDLKDLVLSYIDVGEFELDSMTYLTPDEEKKQKLAVADMVLFAPGRFLSDDIMASAKNVKLMQLWSSGYDKFNITSAEKYNIPVANNGGANACSVAEHAVLLMLSVYKWLPDSHRRVIKGEWTGNSHGMDMFLMSGKTIGIIGFGNIGRQVARKISGFDVRVVYYDIVRAHEDLEKAYGATFVSLEELIKSSDIITLHLHNNKETKDLISEKEFSLMKKNAVLINVSRAELVNYDALYKALSQKQIHGAGMDVYLKEPTTSDDPLFALKNIVATPHMGGSTYDTYTMVMERVMQNFKRVSEGEEPLWVVNKVKHNETY